MAERDPVLADLRSGLVTRDTPASEGPTDLAEILGYRFADTGLLQQAFTHSSAFGSAAGRHRSLSYERLEFLGDRVLGLVIAEMLYQRFPEETEGALARRLAELARKETIARVALSLDLGRHLVISRGEEEGGGRDNPSLLADVCEAVIGALYLDGGLGPAKAFIERNWRKLLAEDVRPPKDAKTALQEWAQGSGLPLPSYRIRSSEGPPHDPVFEVEVAVEGRPPVAGTGRSRRAAEQAAAAALLAAVAPEAIGSRTSD
jgi:ribonuclease-3